MGEDIRPDDESLWQQWINDRKDLEWTMDCNDITIPTAQELLAWSTFLLEDSYN